MCALTIRVRIHVSVRPLGRWLVGVMGRRPGYSRWLVMGRRPRTVTPDVSYVLACMYCVVYVVVVVSMFVSCGYLCVGVCALISVILALGTLAISRPPSPGSCISAWESQAVL